MMSSAVPRSQCGLGVKVVAALPALLAQHDVLALVLADRHRRVRQVRQLEQQRRPGPPRRRSSSPFELFDLLLQRAAVGLRALARLARGGAADLLGQAVLLGLQGLRFVLEVAHARVGGGDAGEVDGGAQALVRRADLVGLVSQEADVDHGPAVYPTAGAAGSAVSCSSSWANSSRISWAAPLRPPPMWMASSSANSKADLEAFAGIQRQRPFQDLRRGIGEAPDALEVLAQEAARGVVEHLEIVVARVEQLAGQAVVEDQPQREQIAARVDRLPARLLGRHEVGVALDHADLRAADAVVRLHDAEVGQLHLAGERHEDVARRDVAVNDPERRAVRGCASCARTPAPAGSRARRSRRQATAARACRARSVALHQASEIAADDVLLGHEVFAADDAEVEDRHDVRVDELRLQARLVDELRHRVLVARQLRAQPLEHERAREALDAGGLGDEQLRHAAFAQAIDQAVAAEHGRGTGVRRDDDDCRRGGERGGGGRGRRSDVVARLARLAELQRRLVNDRDDSGLVRAGSGARGRCARRGASRGPRPGGRRRPGRPRRRSPRGAAARARAVPARRSPGAAPSRAAEEKDRVAAGELGEPRRGQQVRRRADRRLRGGDQLASRRLHDVGGDGRAAAGATRGDDGVAHDHAHERELLAVRAPPGFVVEQVDHRRAVDVRAERGVERAQLGGGLDLALDGEQLRLSVRRLAIRVGAHRRLGLRAPARRRSRRPSSADGNRRRNQRATDESLDDQQSVASRPATTNRRETGLP